MKRVHIFCEGQTEDVFVREVLRPYFNNRQIWLNPIILRSSSRGRGGVYSYPKIKRQVENLCKEDPTAIISTLLDFYGLPVDFPGMNVSGNSMDRAKAVREAFQKDINQPNFLANLVVHEFEALLFSEPSVFGGWFDIPHISGSIAQIREKFPSPEYIDEGRDSAPSKRILALCDNYDKVVHGSLLALDIGLEKICRECPLFAGWLQEITDLAGVGGA
jgi:hypothetical protein